MRGPELPTPARLASRCHAETMACPEVETRLHLHPFGRWATGDTRSVVNEEIPKLTIMVNGALAQATPGVLHISQPEIRNRVVAVIPKAPRHSSLQCTGPVLFYGALGRTRLLSEFR